MRSCGGSCAGGRATRTCRSGNGRSCCPSGRRACPVMFMSARVLSIYATGVLSKSLEVCAWAWIRVAGMFLLFHSCSSVYLPGIIRVCGLPSIFHACLSYASTVLPVCDSETGEGTAICAYPAGIDLATGEGVFVSPHGCRYVVDIRSMSSSRGRSASMCKCTNLVRIRVLGKSEVHGHVTSHPRLQPRRPRRPIITTYL